MYDDLVGRPINDYTCVSPSFLNLIAITISFRKKLLRSVSIQSENSLLYTVQLRRIIR